MGTQIFTYNFGTDGTITVTANAALGSFTTYDGYGPYSGYAVESVSGTIDGFSVGFVSGPATGSNPSTLYDYDNVIFDASNQGYRGSSFGVDGHGIQIFWEAGYSIFAYADGSFFVANEENDREVLLDLKSTDAPCFRRGSRILTERGPVAVEDLVVGDLAVTASGEKKPIRWLGNRTLDCRRNPDPKRAWPICVSAGAFGDDMPSRDLWLSPDHSVAVDGALIPICKLENGQSVVQREQAIVQYWHVELAEHDVILAEGLPTESYIDYGNRSFFANGEAFIQLHPEITPELWPDPSSRVILDGPKVLEAKVKLIERLVARGFVLTSEADAHVIADGKRIEPMALGAMRYGFALPAGCETIALKSRAFVPAYVAAVATDSRTLGLCIKRLQIDGDEVALDDPALSGVGWHDPEIGHRWTTGQTPISANAQLIVIDLAGEGLYWREPDSAVVAVFPQRRRG